MVDRPVGSVSVEIRPDLAPLLAGFAKARAEAAKFNRDLEQILRKGGAPSGGAEATGKVTTAQKQLQSAVAETTRVMSGGARAAQQFETSYVRLAKSQVMAANSLASTWGVVGKSAQDAAAMQRGSAAAAATWGVAAAQGAKAAAGFGKDMKNLGITSVLTANQMRMVGLQTTDIVQQLIAGQAPTMVAIQQGGQLVNALQIGPRGLGGTLAALVRLIPPVAYGITAIGAAIGVTMISAMAYAKTMTDFKNISAGVGAQAGLTAASLETAALEGAKAARISVSAAEGQAKAYATSGKLTADVIGQLIGVGRQYARLTGQDMTDATKVLGAAMADPAKGAEVLNSQLGFLNAAQLQEIQTMAASGEQMRASRLLADELTLAIGQQAEKTHTLGQAFVNAGVHVSNFFHGIGHLADMGFSAVAEAYNRLPLAVRAWMAVGTPTSAAGTLLFGNGGVGPARAPQANLADMRALAGFNPAQTAAQRNQVVLGGQGVAGQYDLAGRRAYNDLLVQQAKLEGSIRAAALSDDPRVIAMGRQQRQTLDAITTAVGEQRQAYAAGLTPEIMRNNLVAKAQADLAKAKTPMAKGEAAAELAKAQAFGQVALAAKRAADAQNAYSTAAARAGASAKQPNRDTSQEWSARIDQSLAQAASQELQARLAITRDVIARGEIQKQIAGEQTKAAQAQVDGVRASIQDDKFLSEARNAALKTALLGRLAEVSAVNNTVAAEKAMGVAQQTAIEYVQQRSAAAQADLQAQVDILRSQEGLVIFASQREAIERKILPLEQQIAMIKAREALWAAEAANDQEAIKRARAKIAALEIEQANNLKAANDNYLQVYDTLTGSLSTMVDAFKANDWGGALRALAEAITYAKTALDSTAQKLGALASIAATAGKLIGGVVGSGLAGAASGAIGGFTAGTAMGSKLGLPGAIIGGIVGLIGGIFSGNAAKREAQQRARQAEAQRLQQIADQHRQLEIQLALAEGNALNALNLQRNTELAAMDASNRELAKQVYAAQDAAAITAERRDLENSLLEISGRHLEAVANARRAELNALQPELRDLQVMVWLRQDEAEAAANAKAVATQYQSLQVQLLTAMGQAEQSLAMKRQMELAALDATLRPIQQAIYAYEDYAAAIQKINDAVQGAASAVDKQISTSQTMAQAAHQAGAAFRSAADSLLETARQLRGGDLSTLSPEQKLSGARGDLEAMFAKAIGGDLASLQALPQVAQEFLTASRGYFASTQAYAADFQRVQAMLAQAGGVATGQAGGADYQATLLDTQTGILQAIKEELSKPDPNTAILSQQSALLGHIGYLLQAQTDQVIVGNSAQDAVKNLAAIDTAYSAQMIQALANNAAGQGATFSGMIQGLNNVVSVLADIRAALTNRPSAPPPPVAVSPGAPAPTPQVSEWEAAKAGIISGDQVAIQRYISANPDMVARYQNPTGNAGDFNKVSGESLQAFAQRHAMRAIATGEAGVNNQGRNLFAAGGMFGGGVRLVGEQGPELEATGPSRIYSNLETKKLLADAMRGAQGIAPMARPTDISDRVSANQNRRVEQLLGEAVTELRAANRQRADVANETIKLQAKGNKELTSTKRALARAS